jgi:hypothetical protein
LKVESVHPGSNGSLVTILIAHLDPKKAFKVKCIINEVYYKNTLKQKIQSMLLISP